MPTIGQVEALLEREPNDVFLNFGLAMALASAGRIADACLRLDRTIELDADYVPAYFQKAQLLARGGDEGAAAAVLEAGIAVAKRIGDRHAEAEMSEFRERLDG
jgi:Tfp pilus assembly protein PilF